MTKTLYRAGRLFADGSYTDESEWVKREDHEAECKRLLNKDIATMQRVKDAHEAELTGTIKNYQHELDRLRSERAAAIDRLTPLGMKVERLRAAIRLILPLAKGYSPLGQSLTAKKTCQSWIEAAEAAVDDGNHYATFDFSQATITIGDCDDVDGKLKRSSRTIEPTAKRRTEQS